MTYKYINPKELKLLKKRRMELMKESERALKNEDYHLLMEFFKEIIEISDKIDDESIKTEFTEKLEFLKGRISQPKATVGVVTNPEQIQQFINDLLMAPQVIIRELEKPIKVSEEVAAKPVPATPVPQKPFTPSKPIVLPVKGPSIPSKGPPSKPPPTKGPPSRPPPTKGPPSRPPPTMSSTPPTKGPPSRPPPTKSSTPPSKGTPIPKQPISSDQTASLPKGIPRPIKPFKSPVKEPVKPYSIPVSSSPKPSVPTPMSSSKSGLSTEDVAIEEEIKKLGTVEDQMKELKRILDEQKKKKIKT